MSAVEYFDEVFPLLKRLREDSGVLAAIQAAGAAMAASLSDGHRIWVSRTTHCLHLEATRRAGGFIAVDVLIDDNQMQPGDIIIMGCPVGTQRETVATAQHARSIGATVVAITNVSFELDPRTIQEHPESLSLHQCADVLIDVGGPFGDGVFEVDELNLRAIPHSGVTEMMAMWMVFSEALVLLRAQGLVPLIFECRMVEGAPQKNFEAERRFQQTHRGVMERLDST